MTQAGPAQIAVHPVRGALRRVLTVAGTALVLGLLLSGGYRLTLSHLRHTRAFRVASTAVRDAPRLQRLVGAPLELEVGAGEVGQDGHASFSFTARGPRGTADVEVELELQGKQWKVTEGSIDTDDGTVPLEER